MTDTWQALGTTAVLSVAGPESGDARRAAQREIDAIDAVASRFRADSELTRVNRRAGGWVKVSPLLWEAIALGLRAAAVSEGAVDPTLGESLIANGYDRDWHSLPSAPAGFTPPIRRLAVTRRRRSLWRMVELEQHPYRVRAPEGVQLDLGATAKALAADRAAAAAHLASGAGALVALGGDIATSGPAPQTGWKVHVTDDHRAGPQAPGQTVSIQAGGLATSSISVRRWMHEGRVMHHILDPRDGQPVRSRWRTVSVAAASCAEANIASTAAIVLGRRASHWLQEQGLPARLVSVGGAVEVRSGWPR
jgi:thiamine biosynthesis lipoprotein